MATPSLEGLRLALLDGEGFSTRRSDDPQPFDPFALPEHFIIRDGVRHYVHWRQYGAGILVEEEAPMAGRSLSAKVSPRNVFRLGYSVRGRSLHWPTEASRRVGGNRRGGRYG